MLFRVIDFETSGEKPDGEVIEVGWIDTDGLSVKRIPHARLIKPERPISVETMAVHHITESAASTGSHPANVFGELGDVPEDFAFVAHSAKFEREWWPDAPARPWICTYKCALRVWPESPRHSNQVLRYFLGMDYLPPHYAMPPHRAAPDAYVTAHILTKLLQRATAEELIEWSAQPALLPRVTFGKHRGTSWRDVDWGFLEWVSIRDFDEDVLHTVRTEMERRIKAEQEARAANAVEA